MYVCVNVGVSLSLCEGECGCECVCVYSCVGVRVWVWVCVCVSVCVCVYVFESVSEVCAWVGVLACALVLSMCVGLCWSVFPCVCGGPARSVQFKSGEGPGQALPEVGRGRVDKLVPKLEN
jgi:hypothetical protein